MEKEVFLTKEGYDKLKREYDELSSTGRKEMAEKIKIAREFGDLSENAEYDAAKEEQGFLEKRIREINEMLSNCTIIDESTIDTKTVSVGCIVRVDPPIDPLNVRIGRHRRKTFYDRRCDFFRFRLVLVLERVVPFTARVPVVVEHLALDGAFGHLVEAGGQLPENLRQ